MTTRPSRPPFALVLLLLCATACDSSSDGDRDATAEDGGKRDPGAGDAGATDAGDVDDADLDSSADELAEPDGGGADSGPDEPAETLSPESYCEQMAALYYEYLHACYGGDSYPDSEREQRVEGYRARCVQVQAAIEGGRIAYDAVRAHACVEASKVGGCARQLGTLCEGVFQGLVEPGGDCYVEETLIFMVGVSACADGFCDEEAACPGTCRALPERGEDCDEGRCRADDHCDGDDVCRALKGAGQPCVEAIECASGFVCTDVDGEQRCARAVQSEGAACSASAPCGGLTTCLDGECSFARSLGEACSLHAQCPEAARCILMECAELGGLGAECTTDPDCQSSLFCDTSLDAPQCAALPAAGEPCAQERCAAGASCRHDLDDGAGTCRALVGQGESCMVGVIRDDERCQEGLHCIEDGTCEPPGELGEPCGAFIRESCVEGLWCSRETYTCEPPAGQGEACNPAWLTTCAEGLGCACGVEDVAQCFNYVREHVATDTCQPLVGAGDCFRPHECSSGTCSADFEGPSDVPGACAQSAAVCLP